MTVRDAFTIAILSAGIAACSPDRISGPMTPSPPSPNPNPNPTGSRLIGFVGDTAFRPLQSVTVEVLDGPRAGESTVSDASGAFTFTGTFDITTSFRASRDGYLPATNGLTQCATCANPYLSFTLAPPMAPVDISGDYMVTFVADSACSSIPENLRTRTYSASMEPVSGSASVPANTQFRLQLQGGDFLPDYNAIWVGVAGNLVAMSFGGYGHGPYVVDQVTPNTYLGFDGAVEFVTDSRPHTLETSFDGFVDYCALKQPMGDYYSCQGGGVIAREECRSPNHRLIVTRR